MEPSVSRVRPAAPGGPWQRLSGSALRWWTGTFCSFVGAFMVVAPQEFRSAGYRAIELRPVPTGFAFLLAGGALLAVAAIRPRRRLRLVAHLVASAVLALLGAGFLLAGAWTGAVFYLALVAGLVVSADEPVPPRRPPVAWRGDLLSFVFGAAGSVAGALFVAAPSAFRPPLYPPDALDLRLLGLALLLTSPYLALVQVRREPPPVRSLWTAHLLAGVVFLVVTLTLSLPFRAWTGFALYGSGGLVVTLLPWLRRRYRDFDPGALRTRLALAFAATTTLALIATVAVLTAGSEIAAQSEAAEAQQESALTAARNVVDYLELVGARNASLAAAASRRPDAPDELGVLLVEAARDHPRITALGVFARDGTPIARTGRRTIPRIWAREIGRSLSAEPADGSVQRLFHDERVTMLVAASTVYDADDRPTAMLITGYDTRAVLGRLSLEGLTLRLLDESGRTIASEAPPPADSAERLIAASAPVAGLGWTVVAERSETAALAALRRQRLTAFMLLLGMVLLSIVSGAAAARYVARPLQGLADAVDRVAAGDEWRPLMPTGISELDRLSANFRDMRDRLTARTAESERLTEELRARADALADADRRKDEFLAMLSHELRNPLGAISTAAYLLDQLPSDDPRIRHSSGVIRRQMRHLIRMVDDLLDVSRITRGKVGLRRSEVDLGEIVERAAEAAEPLMKAAGHRFTVRPPEEPVVLHADATRLEQVLGNLLRNAAKYTPREGRVELEAGREGDEAVIRVRDDGVGIAPELLPRIFDLFAQGEQTLDRARGGLGIGLTLVRQLVELHGGTVEARSDGPGRGCELTVRLPLRADAALDDTTYDRRPAVAVGDRVGVRPSARQRRESA